METIYRLKLLPLVVFLTIGIAFQPASVQAELSNSAQEESIGVKNPTYLYIQTAKSAEIHYNSTDKTYSLTLHESDPWIIYFSNVPDRVTNFTTTAKFIMQFKKDLAEKNEQGLNAGLIGLEDNTEKMVRYTFTLTAPKYDATSHEASYTAHIIPGPQVTPIPHSSQFHHVALFIDGCADCGGSGF